MNIVFDPVFDEVELAGSAAELARLVAAVAGGKEFVAADPVAAPDGESLAGVEIEGAPGPGVLIGLDSRRRMLVVSGDPVARTRFADQLAAMTAAMAVEAGGGHRHIDYCPGHPYLVEGSVRLVVGMPGVG
ncbi:hypothetical protein ACFC58_23995 [Kitasatospora purpeofusca]|uniref:Imm32 family immunity protein n=1 Tax=Kitasatospora purpeofusca TaxID=67352 RepID=UPI0035D589A0